MKQFLSIIKILKQKGLKYKLNNKLSVSRDSIVIYYNNLTENEAYDKLLKEIKDESGLNVFYSMRTDNYLWISFYDD